MKKLLSSIAIIALIASPAFAGKPDPQQRLERMSEELNLSEGQQEQIQAIMEQQRAQHDALREQYTKGDEQGRAQMHALREQGATDIAAVLSPEQQEKFSEMRARHRAQKGNRCGDGKGQGKQQNAQAE